MSHRSLFIHSFICIALSVSFSQSYAHEPSTKPVKSDLVAQTPQEDAKIIRSIEHLIKTSKTLSKLNVQVSVNKGVVTLTGKVNSDAQASSLVEIAESIIGVADVDTSKLTVENSTQPLEDTYITAKVKGLMVREELFGEKDIALLNTSVETKDGVVYLKGAIDNKAQVDNTIEIIKKHIPEVKKVEYSIKTITPVNGQ